MASFYFDTSALIKLYIEEEGTEIVLDLAEDDDSHQIVILDIALLESRSAVRRRERDGDISEPDANRVLRQIEDDGSSLYLVQPLSSAVIEEAARLIDSHPLRAIDALQLAGCVVVRYSVPPPLTFVCADVRLCEVAGFEGLTTLNPLADHRLRHLDSAVSCP